MCSYGFVRRTYVRACQLASCGPGGGGARLGRGDYSIAETADGQVVPSPRAALAAARFGQAGERPSRSAPCGDVPVELIPERVLPTSSAATSAMVTLAIIAERVDHSGSHAIAPTRRSSASRSWRWRQRSHPGSRLRSEAGLRSAASDVRAISHHGIGSASSHSMDPGRSTGERSSSGLAGGDRGRGQPARVPPWPDPSVTAAACQPVSHAAPSGTVREYEYPR